LTLKAYYDISALYGVHLRWRAEKIYSFSLNNLSLTYSAPSDVTYHENI
jgi:hypothetical protein